MDPSNEKNRQSLLNKVNISLNDVFPDTLTSEYIIGVGDCPLVNPTIEQEYGPFNNNNKAKNHAPSSPNINSSNGNSPSMSSPSSKELEIAALKEKIAKWN
ncbi:unnamed protein product [Cunninghamella blakesleeana]